MHTGVSNMHVSYADDSHALRSEITGLCLLDATILRAACNNVAGESKGGCCLRRQSSAVLRCMLH